MNTEMEHKRGSRLFVPVLVFVLLFLLFGAIGFFATAEDFRGSPPDYAMCWTYFFVYGGIAGTLGFLIARFAGSMTKWWREPVDKK
ncbi:MAG TPA: hypothetical protein V6D08_16430 [Candidatus Obscuribacterales bacterium]